MTLCALKYFISSVTKSQGATDKAGQWSTGCHMSTVLNEFDPFQTHYYQFELPGCEIEDFDLSCNDI